MAVFARSLDKGVGFGEFSPVFLQGVIGHEQFHVGDRKGEVEEERLIFMVIDEVEGLPDNKVVRVGPALVVEILLQDDFFFVPPEELRVIQMGIALVQVAEPVVKASPVWCAGRLRLAQAPFAHDTGGIARFLQDFRHGSIFRAQRNTLARGPAGVPPYPRMARVLTCHQAAA
ncbi:hypothetical protein ES708_32758 [subsurface metagenome]